MFEHLRKIPAKDKNILRFSEVSNAWRSKITGYFSEERRTSEQADRRENKNNRAFLKTRRMTHDI